MCQLSNAITVVDEAENGAQLLDLLKGESVDLVLLDLNMPGMGGMELLSIVHERYPDLPVLVLSMHNEPQIVTRAIKSGASGYLTKDSEPETLLDAIRKVAGGGRFIDPKLAERMVFDLGLRDQPKAKVKLSERELQILRLLGSGKSVTDIANELFISNKTVSTHKIRLMEKLNLKNTVDLIRYCDNEGFNL